MLAGRRDHLERPRERLEGLVRNLATLRGGMISTMRRKAAMGLRLADHQERLVPATGRHRGEGFDDPRPDTLFLTTPIS